jgi:hypothetical protein
MTYEPKEREILDQVVAALHGHYGERLSARAFFGSATGSIPGTSAVVGGVSGSLPGTSAIVGGATGSVPEASATVGGASGSVPETSAVVGGAILGIFIHPARGEMAKKRQFLPADAYETADLRVPALVTPVQSLT